MKRQLVFLSLLTLAGCINPATETAKTTNSHIQVDLLFENDGVKVYRFADGGKYIYYTDARGSTEWQTRHGKHSVKDRVDTVSEVSE